MALRFSQLLVFPVPLVGLTIATLWLLGFHVIREQYSFASVKGVGHALLFGFLGLMTLTTFLASVTVHPGRVPTDYEPDVEREEAAVLQVKKSTGEARLCRKCDPNRPLPKPPRAHHCKSCGTCILRLCHHCPWLGGCIGHYNYRAYFLFLFYVVLSLWELTRL